MSEYNEKYLCQMVKVCNGTSVLKSARFTALSNEAKRGDAPQLIEGEQSGLTEAIASILEE